MNPEPTAPATSLDQCDLIMKGGITSGVVYPMAVCELASRYRFRRIGGSSAGAIGAVLAAAAEYRRGRQGTTDTSGFAGLNRIPQLLTDGDTLFELFRPSPSTAAVFRFVMVLLDKSHSAASRAVSAAAIVVRSAWPVFALVLVGALAPGLLVARWLAGNFGARSWLSLLVWLPGALLLALTASAFVSAARAVRRIDANAFGLAIGHDGANQDGRTPPLTDWLSAQINIVAGRSASDVPLTFGDLWGPDATAWYQARAGADDGCPQLTDMQWLDAGFDPDIDLKVMTTCLTLGLPYTFPFASDEFCYCPACMRAYFPDNVTAHLDACSRPAGPWTEHGRELSTDCPRHPGTPVRRFPQRPDIPIVLAARLSLSFPVLISAVPLYYVDFAKLPAQRGLVTAWFSDGGICSNFPMHFFDTLLPGRPTFGINLAQTDDRYPAKQVSIPATIGVVHPREKRLTQLSQFLGAVMDTMQNWPDTLQAAAPGFRDRIVQVYLGPDEGRLNLRMGKSQVDALADRGRRAGQQILATFNFERHRWTRFRVTMNGLSGTFERMRTSYPRFAEALPGPWAGAYQVPASIEGELRDQAAQVATMAGAWSASGYPATTDPPDPEPQLRFGAHL